MVRQVSNNNIFASVIEWRRIISIMRGLNKTEGYVGFVRHRLEFFIEKPNFTADHVTIEELTNLVEKWK